MKSKMLRYSLIGLAVIALGLAGCIISGTFVIVEDFEFTITSELYWDSVDLTDDPDWEDHKDDIENIDAVGFEMDINNMSGSAVTFTAYLGDYDESPNGGTPTVSWVQNNATQVLAEITVPAGMSTITYSESIGKILAVAYIKSLLLSGQFNFYGIASGGTGTFEIDEGKVIVTVTASGS